MATFRKFKEFFTSMRKKADDPSNGVGAGMRAAFGTPPPKPPVPEPASDGGMKSLGSRINSGISSILGR